MWCVDSIRMCWFWGWPACVPLSETSEKLLLDSLQKMAGYSASFRPGTLHLFLNVIRRQRQCYTFTKVGCCASDCLPGSPFLALCIEFSPEILDVSYMWNPRQGDELTQFSSIFLYRMCPIFQISNVTGENLDLLKMFLNLLSPRTSYREEEPAEFQIDDTYSVPVRGLLFGRIFCLF